MGEGGVRKNKFCSLGRLRGDQLFLKPWKHVLVPLYLIKLCCCMQVTGAPAVTFYHLHGQVGNACCDGAASNSLSVLRFAL